MVFSLLWWRGLMVANAEGGGFDTGSINELLPLGGATVLLIYLLKVLVQERGQWVKEREILKAEHRAETAEMKAERLKEREADLARVIQLRSAIDHCNAEIEELRNKHDEDQMTIGRLRSSNAQLQDELDETLRLMGDGPGG